MEKHMESVSSIDHKFDSLLAAILAKLSVGADHTALDAMTAERDALKATNDANQAALDALGAKFDKAIAELSA